MEYLRTFTRGQVNAIRGTWFVFGAVAVIVALVIIANIIYD